MLKPKEISIRNEKYNSLKRELFDYISKEENKYINMKDKWHNSEEQLIQNK